MKVLLTMVLLCTSFLAAKTVTLEIEGMTCPLCTTAIKKSLKKVPGVTKVKVKLNTRKATVSYEGNVTEAQLLEAVKKAGYSAKVTGKDEKKSL